MRTMRLTGRGLVAAMCIGQIGSLLPHVVVPAVMPQHLIPLWHLSGTEAGLMASAYFIGYMLAVPVLSTLTDRIDARIILLAGSALNGLATWSFAVFAEGIVSAIILWGLVGIGFAGAYMPGLKALTDRLKPGEMSRSLTLYVASFGLGVGLSFLVAQLAAEHLGWRAAFYLAGIGPLAMVAAALCMVPVPLSSSARPPFDFMPVIRNRIALGFVLGYGAHVFELYGLRSWLVAFWTYVAGRSASPVLQPITLSVIVTFVTMPAQIIGNEAAIRYGRPRAILCIMGVAGIIATSLAFTVDASPEILLVLVFLYAVLTPADAGALNAGMAASAHPDYRGATMAFHSTVGFSLAAVGSWAVGVALDMGGGMTTVAGWSLAFLVMAIGGLMGPIALWWSSRQASTVTADPSELLDRSR
jgi:MFS family permease